MLPMSSPKVRQRLIKVLEKLGLPTSITADPEKVLILLMLFVLYKNKADIKLLLALGYLLV